MPIGCTPHLPLQAAWGEKKKEADTAVVKCGSFLNRKKYLPLPP